MQAMEWRVETYLSNSTIASHDTLESELLVSLIVR